MLCQSREVVVAVFVDTPRTLARTVVGANTRAGARQIVTRATSVSRAIRATVAVGAAHSLAPTRTESVSVLSVDGSE